MERTIKVIGKGQLSLTPDTVRVRIELIDREKEYEAAIRKSAEHSKEVREAFIRLGFKAEDLKTQSFRVDTEYESYQDKEDNCWKQRLVGYMAAHSLKVEFPREDDLLGKVLYQTARLSGKPEFQVEYTVKDPEKARNKLLEKAIEDSRAKAEVLTKAAGVSLAEIVTIDYSWNTVEFVARPMNRMMAAKCLDSAEESIDFDVTPDDIRVEDTVTVIWEIAWK